MTEPTLSGAIHAHFTAGDVERRTTIANELRDFKPDPWLEQVDERIKAMRAAGDHSPVGDLTHRLDAYRNRKAQAAAFQATGLLPDGTTPPGDDAA